MSVPPPWTLKVPFEESSCPAATDGSDVGVRPCGAATRQIGERRPGGRRAAIAQREEADKKVLGSGTVDL